MTSAKAQNVESDEGKSDELRVTSAKATSPAIRHSSFEIRNSESSALVIRNCREALRVSK